MNEHLILSAIFRTLVEIPSSTEPQAADPDEASDKIVRKACKKAGLLSAALSLPTGPLGLITLMPDLTGVWKIQSQMVSDIASVYGEHKRLEREQMLFFLFRHSMSHFAGDVIAKSGERYLVQKLSEKAFGNLLEKIALRVGSNVTLRATKIVFPLIGSAFLGAYSYRDTLQVGVTTKGFFRMQNEPTPRPEKLNGKSTSSSRLPGIVESAPSFESAGETNPGSQSVVIEPGI